MQKGDLLRLAAAHARIIDFEDLPYGEQERMEKADRELRDRASLLIDSGFERFKRRLRPDIGSPNKKRGFRDVADGEATWSCEESVIIIPGSRYQKRTRRWLMLKIPEEDYRPDDLEDFDIVKRVIIGTHDFEYSYDGGKTWGDKSPAVHLESMTRVYAVPGCSIIPEDLKYDHVAQRAMDGFTILERLEYSFAPFNCDDYVFNDPDEAMRNGFDRIPYPFSYSSPHELIFNIHASLDEFEG